MTSKRKPSSANDNAPREPRILVFDIESTNLSASFGTILCIGFKFVGEPETRVVSILDGRRRDMLDDKRVVEEFVKVYETADYVVTWYGDRFDLPMIKSKMLEHGLPPLMPKPSLDLWKAVRYRFKLHSNRLQAWQQFLGVEHKKTPIDFKAWLRAAQGDKTAMAEVVHHCKLDVEVLEGVFHRIRPWIDNEPARGLITGDHSGCPSCGSDNIQRRGYKVAQTRAYQQFNCLSCGRWWRAKTPAALSPVRAAA